MMFGQRPAGEAVLCRDGSRGCFGTGGERVTTYLAAVYAFRPAGTFLITCRRGRGAVALCRQRA
jgi:hypothetical protein